MTKWYACIFFFLTRVFSLYLVNAEEKLASTVDSSGLRLYQFLNTSVIGTCVRSTCKKNTRIYTNDNMDTCEKTVNIATESFHKTLCVDVREYNPSRFKDDVSKASRDNCVRKVWVSWSCSEAFAEEIPQVIWSTSNFKKILKLQVILKIISFLN